MGAGRGTGKIALFVTRDTEGAVDRAGRRRQLGSCAP
jgi:hypothetical protein